MPINAGVEGVDKPIGHPIKRTGNKRFHFVEYESQWIPQGILSPLKGYNDNIDLK